MNTKSLCSLLAFTFLSFTFLGCSNTQNYSVRYGGWGQSAQAWQPSQTTPRSTNTQNTSDSTVASHGTRRVATNQFATDPLIIKTNSWGGYHGKLSANKYDPDSISNPYGRYGSKFSPDSVNNPYGEYGSPYSSKSVTNPYATDTPKLYDSKGNYRGKLSANKYDPDSISNPYGRYGSKFSPDSVNNPYGAGNPYKIGSGVGIYSGSKKKSSVNSFSSGYKAPSTLPTLPTLPTIRSSTSRPSYFGGSSSRPSYFGGNY
jgi:hypothetical protein